MAKTYDQFKSEVLGHCYDIDGYYGAQCWDGTAYYQRWLGYPVIYTDIHGFACDIWESRKTNGMLKNFTEVRELQSGDVVVFRKVDGWTPLSHIAIFDSDAGNGYGWFLGQNQGAKNGAFSLQMLPYFATFDTAFRPNCFIGSNEVKHVEKENHGDVWSDTIVHVGDTVKSISCTIEGISGNCVNVPTLGGLIPMTDVSESSDTKDGKCDNVLMTVDAKVFLDPCVVEAVDVKSNIVKVHGYWVNAEPLLVKR